MLFVNPSLPPYDIFPVGDSALSLDFGNQISEEINSRVISLFHRLKASPLRGMTEVVPAYSSITIYYDPVLARKFSDLTAFRFVCDQLESFINNNPGTLRMEGRLLEIPVCYELPYAPDLPFIASRSGISMEEVVKIHMGSEYRVYMMGFLPGFAYMGIVDDKIAAPRKSLPANVLSGSVGIAGNQTGIYPLDSPGGWQIIGRTPVGLFDPSLRDPVYFRAGDKVSFYSINSHEFENYQAGPA